MKKIVALLISSMAFAQTVTKSILLLPDTGQTTSYTTTFGEDNDYDINSSLFVNNGDGTITDLITGLIWQQIDGGEMTFENAIEYCNSLTLAGYTDWRLPSPLEAFTISNLQNVNPAQNTMFFTPSLADYWWTDTFQVVDTSKVWVTNAGGGIGNHPKNETISAGGNKKIHVRAVRTDTPIQVILNRFLDNGDGTITDNLTQLIWQKVPNLNSLTWEQALQYSENLSLAGQIDWRLPNIKEIQSLTDYDQINPSINSLVFNGIGIHNYWSSTTLKPNPSNPLSAWIWNTQFGITTYEVKTNLNYVLCVRGIPTLGVHSLEPNVDSIQVFPNPFTSKIVINSSKKNVNCRLFSITGQLIYSGFSIEKEDFTALKKGKYLLIIDGYSTPFSLIKA
jgi:hypothetical protein